MSLIAALLQAIVQVDGDALVMHPGDTPYAVTPSGQVELSRRALALDAADGVVKHLLSVERRHALEEFGAAQHELPAFAEFPGETFTVVAARSGDDLWIEIRRRRVPGDIQLPGNLRASKPAEGGDNDAALLPPDAEPIRPPDAPAALDTGQMNGDRMDADRMDGNRVDVDGDPAEEQEIPQPARVLSLSRTAIQPAPPPQPDGAPGGLERLLRLAAARGASTLYVSSASRPSVRVDGELHLLDGEPVLSARDIESLLASPTPGRLDEASRASATTEWISEVAGVGRVRCASFRDHLGPGGVFRLMPNRPVTADHLGLPRHVQALAIEPAGLVLVVGARSSGKRTLMSAFVDLINRTRRDHVIVIEREIHVVHERGQAFISQREVRGTDDDLLAAAREAIREDPDVLVVEDLSTGPLLSVALEASSSGRLVIGGAYAHSAAGAIDHAIRLYPPEQQRQVQLALADALRGVVVQVLLRKTGGGRVPVREVLLNTPAVSGLIAEGKTVELSAAIEGGRRYGMAPLNDGLVALVHSSTVDAREAYRHATDRTGFLAALKRQGLDTSFVERLA